MAKKNKVKSVINTIALFNYPAGNDWGCLWERNTVLISLKSFLPSKRIHISVMEVNDFSLEKEFFSATIQEFEQKIVELKFWLETKLPNPLTRQWLREQGFKND